MGERAVQENKDNSFVVMDNKMIRAKYGKLSDVESRFIFFAISRIKYNDTEFERLRFSVGTLLKELDVSGNNYTFLFNVLKKVVEKSIVIPDDKGVSIFPWFVETRVEKTGDVEVQFNEKLKPFLLQLRKNFTKAELSIILTMSNHTRRIYLICRQYLNIGYFEKNIADLRTELELGKVFQQYKYMARDLLEPAEKEINEQSDIRVSFKPIRVGRSYARLGIYVRSAPAVDKKPAEETKRIEEKRRKVDVEYKERVAEDDRMVEERIRQTWEKECKKLEPYLTRKSKIWQRCLDSIEKALNSGSTFYTWFEFTEMFLDEHRTAYILTPNKLAADTMRDSYLNIIMEILMKNKIDVAAVKVVTSDIKTQFSNAVAVHQSAEENTADEEVYPNLFENIEQTSLFLGA
jgi:plasmid replication initiation protein